jgi:hypothetical protein
MDLRDPTPAGSELRLPVPGPGGRAVAQFTPTRHVNPAEVWEPFSRPTSQSSDGSQGNPLGSFRPGRDLEHEPVDQTERMAQRTAQTAAKDQDGPQLPAHAQVASGIRAALRRG